jgi:signal-transduction protein with cAMP-binding, CBS, and nucleotidyltransferase domain
MTGTLDISDSRKLTTAPDGGRITARLGSWQLRPTFFADISNRNLGDIVRCRRAVTLPETATVQLACCMMRDRRVGAIMVTGAEGRLVGLFTGRDAVCRVLSEALDPETTRLCAVMTLEPDSLPPEKRASDALRMMHDGGYRHLPVVDGWYPIGIVSRGDLIAHFGRPVAVSG